MPAQAAMAVSDLLFECAIREIMNLREELEARSRMLIQDGDN